MPRTGSEQSTAAAEHDQPAFASVQCIKTGVAQNCCPLLRRIRRGAELHVSADGGLVSSVAALPPALHRGTYYFPAKHCTEEPSSDNDEQVVVKVLVPTRVYLLWPSLQELPSWCGHEFELIRGAEIKVCWSEFTRQQRFYLNVTNQRQLYQEQVLLVLRLRGNHGYLMPGEEIELPYTTRRGTTGAEQPFFGHVICLRPAREVSASGAGNSGSQEGGFCKPLSSYSLLEIITALEDGFFSPAELRRSDADDILQQAVAAADDELMFLLLDGGIGGCCSQPCLQILLQYAQYEDTPELAFAVLQQSQVELTQPVLDWLVRHLIADKHMPQAEAVLVPYCMTRRNPLSSVAAVEYAVFKAAKTHVVINESALQLSHSFRAVKHALLQQLAEQYSTDHISLCDMQLSSGGVPSGHRYLMREATTSRTSEIPYFLQVRPLQQATRRCMQKLSAYRLGSHGSNGPVSIHDVSPWSLAISIEDTAFLQHPVVAAYTRRLWRGYELHKMALAWQAAAADPLAHGGGGGSICAGGRLARKSVGRRSEAAAGAAPATSSMLRPAVAAALAAGGVSQRNPDVWPDHEQLLSSSAATVRQARLPGAATSTSGSGAAATTAEGSAPCLLGDHTPVSARPTAQWPSMGPAAMANPAAASRPLAAAKLQHESTAGPCAEAVEDSQNNSQAATPAAANSGGVVRRRSTQEWASVSSDNLEDKDPATYSKRAVMGVVWLDPDIGIQLFQNLGLAGGIGLPICRSALRLLHGILLTPRALHGTPRSRWIMRCMIEAYFLVMYMGLCVGFIIFESGLYSLTLIILGNFVNICWEVRWLHTGSFKHYIRSNWAKLDVLVNSGLFVAMFTEYRLHYDAATEKLFEESAMWSYGVDLAQVMVSVLAFLVWARALGVFAPVSERLGAMLYTLRKAAAEALVMVPLVVVLIFSFASTLYVVYHKFYKHYSSMAGTLRMIAVIALGGHHEALEFAHKESHGNPFLVAWGQFVILMFGVIFNILIMTLLIAIIHKTYNPESMKAKAVLMTAETVGQYDWQVRHGLAGSPSNLLQLALSWLPQGYRTRVSHSKCIRLGIPPLDGYAPDIIAASPAMLIPTGPSEVAYLMFHLLIYPMFTAAIITLMVLHLPFGVLHFATKGYFMWSMSAWSGGSNKQEADSRNPASAEAEAMGDNLSDLPVGEGSQQAAKHRGHCQSVDGVGRVESYPASALSSSAGGALGLKQLQHPGSLLKYQNSSVGPRRQVVDTQHTSILRLPLPAARAVGWLSVLLLQFVGSVGLGLVIHLALLVITVTSILLAFVTRVLFSLYCIFVPWAADANCCMRPTRYADFWTGDRLQKAFESAKLNAGVSYGSEQGYSGVEKSAGSTLSATVPPFGASNQTATGSVRFSRGS